MTIYYSADEAADWLHEQTGEKCTRQDILRLAELGEVPICFKYHGFVGYFPYPGEDEPLDFGNPDTPHVQPRSDRRGYLRALNIPVLGQTLATDGKKHRTDYLEPVSVEPAEIGASSPAWESLADELGYVVLIGDDGAPAHHIILSAAWLFHSDDLHAYYHWQLEREAESHALDQAERLAAAGRKGGKVRANNLETGRNERIWKEYQALMDAGHQAPTHTLASRFGLTDSRIRQILRSKRKTET